MKTTLLLFAVILGYITPTYSQYNRHRKMDATIEHFKNEMDEFGNYKFDKFRRSLNDRTLNGFNASPMKPAANKSLKEICSEDDMPCFRPNGYRIPCSKLQGSFSMRVWKPECVIWGTLW